jgi:hypothetical protein
MFGYIPLTGKLINAYKIVVGKPERKRLLRDLDFWGEIILK